MALKESIDKSAKQVSSIVTSYDKSRCILEKVFEVLQGFPFQHVII